MTNRSDAVVGRLRELGALAVRAGHGVRWYMRNLMGDSAYETYLAHHRRQHTEAEPMSERAFWRDRMDAQDRNPGARCC